MKQIFSLAEAVAHFNNSSDDVLCIKGHHQATCSSYEEATNFFSISESETNVSDSDDALDMAADLAVVGMMMSNSDIFDSSPDTSSSPDFDFGGGGDGFDGGGASSDF